MIFHEIYGCYYNCVAKILKQAVNGVLTDERMSRIIRKYAFSESALTIIPALKNQQWQLLDNTLSTPLKHTPTMPLTILQMRWLKAISLDPRIRLFRVDLNGLENIVPLFTPDDYVVFDKYSDGDPFDDEAYFDNFHTILDAMHQNRKPHIQYTSRKGGHRTAICIPSKLEYSEKDDKFRLLTTGCRFVETINLNRIVSCKLSDEYPASFFHPRAIKKGYFVLELVDDRNALERVMLHFAHFEKQAEKMSGNHYRIKIFYDRDDETELVIRVLSFGPLVKVTDPPAFVELIKERLTLQKSCELR